MAILSGPSLTAFRRARLAIPAVPLAPSTQAGPADRLRCEAVTTTSGFHALEAEWSGLQGQCRRPSPFSGWDFAVEWWRHFVLGQAGRATGRFQVIVVRDAADAVLAIVPLYEEMTKGAAGVGVRLQPFGRSYSFEAMSDEPIALFHREHEWAAREAVRDHLTEQARSGSWDIAVIRGGTAGDGTLTTPVRLKRRTAELARAVEAPMLVRLPERWEAFRSGLSKSMRDNLSYYPKRLDREAGAWSIRAARTPAEVALATEALIALHRQRSHSRVGKPHCNHISTNTHAAFMRCWFQRLARQGAVTIMVFETGAGIRAAQAFLHPTFPSDGRATGRPKAQRTAYADVYYSGHGEDVHRFSALTLMTAAWLKLSIERGLALVRFPPGSASWSARWGARPEEAVDETSIYAINGATLLRAIARRGYLGLRGG